MRTDLPFGIWVKKRRKALDLTQGMLANRVGCSLTLIVKIESGERRPSLQIAELLATALDISPEDRGVFLKIARGEGGFASLEKIPQPAVQVSPTNLPFPSTPLVGREEELAGALGLLKNRDCRLITITGMGGIGKTRLAIKTGMKALEIFPHGVFFVALAGVGASEYLPSVILDTFHIGFDGVDDPKTRLLNYFHEKNLLLILDNFEHLLDGSSFLVDLLEYAPNLKILTTSHEPLSLRGEWLVDLKGLSVTSEDGVDGAAALFLQVASRTSKKFRFTDQDKPAIERICRMVDGNPLATELAATWTRTLTFKEIAQEIEKNLDFLSSTLRDLPVRHSSMRAVFDHSWSLLTKGQRNALMKLAVFRGGFTRQAGEQVASATLQTLSALVMKSLVQRTSAERYELHEVVRQYAFRQLEAAGEKEKTQRLHVAYFTEFAENADYENNTVRGISWLGRMEQENDNLRAALNYVLALKDSQAALHLGAALLIFWERRGMVYEGRRWLGMLLDIPAVDTDEYTRFRVRALTGSGKLARIQGDFAVAYKMHEESLTIRRRIADVEGIASSLNSLGVLNMFEGHYALAENYFQESLQLYQKLDNKKMAASKINNLGVNAMYQGQYKKAQTIYEESIRMYRELDSQFELAGSLGNLGDVLRRQSDYDHAMQVLEESLTLFQKLGDVHGSLITLGSIARVHTARGDFQQALSTFYSSLALNREVGDKAELAVTLEGVVDALGKRAESPAGTNGDLRFAVRLLGAASQLRRTIGVPRSVPERAEYEEIVGYLQDRLMGDDFAGELEGGSALTTDMIFEVVLSYLPAAG